MAKRTEEYLAMIKATVRLTDAVKNELTPLSQELVARELISVDQGVELRNGNVGAVDRAANLVALVTNKVGQDRKNFYVFVEVLTDNRSVYKEILEDLQPIYKTGNHLYNKGARAILTVRQPWYHKRLSREDAEKKLGDGGTDSFLVRESAQEVGKLVLSIRSGDNFFHFPIERGVGSYQVEGTEEPFPSLVELIDHYIQHGLPESDSGELVIFKSPCICDASLVSSKSSVPESSNGEVSISSLPKLSSDYTYVDVATNDSERSVGSESDYTYVEVTDTGPDKRVAELTSDIKPQNISPPTNDDSHEYESLDDPEGRILPPTLPPKPHVLPPSMPLGPIIIVPTGDMPWYWGKISREETARLLQGAPDGSFLVRDSTRTRGEYTLTLRKGGANKHIHIMNKNGKFGLSEPTVFSSIQNLIEFYTINSLSAYNSRLDITLSNPISKFEFEEESPEDTDALLEELQVVTDKFDQKNEDYVKMEEQYEQLRKELERAKRATLAQGLLIEMIKEQLTKPQSALTGLSRKERRAIIENAKLIGEKLHEATKNHPQLQRRFMQINMEFRTMDKDINTMRPELMKLQREKEHYTSQLMAMGMTREEIAHRVKEKTISESETIYGTLYGTLNDVNKLDETASAIDHLRPQRLPVPPPRQSSGKNVIQSPRPPPIPPPGVKPKPKETWYCEIDRWQSRKLLEGKPNGTFLCRPASRLTTIGRATHTHTVDIQYNDQKHLKVLLVDGFYGFSERMYSHRTLEDLVLHYSVHSLKVHNKQLTTTLKYPVKADNII